MLWLSFAHAVATEFFGEIVLILLAISMLAAHTWYILCCRYGSAFRNKKVFADVVDMILNLKVGFIENV